MTPASPLSAFLHWEKEKPDMPFLRQPFEGQWKTWTYKQAGDEIRRVANALTKLSLPPNSNVALLSKNCAHWIMSDLAIMMGGFISVPLYPTLSDSGIRQILEHSESKAIIIGKLDNYDKQSRGIPDSIVRIGIEAYSISEDRSWESMLREEPLAETHQWKEDDLITIIYTSGTTGEPKGVMHTTGTFNHVVQIAISDLSLPKHPRLFSYLPLSHIAERMGIEFVGLYSGAYFSFPESIEGFPKNLADTQPDIFFAVPRLWAKFQEKILKQLPQKRLTILLALPVIKNMVQNKIKKKLGLSRATHIYSGAAPIALELLKWFDKIGIEIFQAYGMTEDCIYSHFNRHNANRFGTVGQPLTGVEVKFSESGEILLKCPGLMKGYFKQPDLTATVFEGGYLKTGDIGEYDEGFLVLTGRAKDQFKTDKGKYISPSPIETLWMANDDVEHVCVVGVGMPQPIILVTLSEEGKIKPKEKITFRLLVTLSTVNAQLENYEAIAKVVVMSSDWTIVNGLLTPKLSVRRYAIEQLHMGHYARWYEEEGIVIWE